MDVIRTFTVEDLMTPAPRAMMPDQPMSWAAALMRDEDVGAIPVIRDLESWELVGIITDRDIVVRHVVEHHDWDCSVEEHMTAEDLVTVEPGDDALHAIRLMKDARVRRLPVTDEKGRLLGMLSLADVARHLGPDLPGTVEDLLEALSEPTHLPVYA
jgi:CBS domain-containing protein